MKRISRWPLALLAAPAFVAIWGGWVGLGELAGFGEINLLPGIVADGGWATINSAITLPIGVEAYAAYALRAWLTPGDVPPAARQFAKVSAIGALALGALGQVAYHLLAAAHVSTAPWWITTLVACFPVAVLGMGAALAHLLNGDEHQGGGETEPATAGQPAAIEPAKQLPRAANTAIMTAKEAAAPVAIEPATERPPNPVVVASRVATATAKRRPAVATDTATQVAKLVAKEPAIDAAAVAARLAIPPRTARRHVAAAKATAEPATPVNGRVPDISGVTP